MQTDQIRAELEAVLSGAALANSDRSRQLLRYLVDQALAGNRDELKEYTIALEVFGRDSSYDPRTDSTVRVQIGKLRDRLKEHYLTVGRDSAVRIEIPKGSYVPLFHVAPEPPETAPAVDAQPVPSPMRRWLIAAAAAVVILSLTVLLTAVLTKRFTATRPPVFHQLTSRRGMIGSARFAPDGHTVVYSAEWEGDPSDTFVTQQERTDARSLNLPLSHLLAVGHDGQMAVDLNSRYTTYFEFTGTLAQTSLTGSAPRELMKSVLAADWSPDGSRLAVIRQVNGNERLEYPIGKALVEVSPPAWLGDVRISPRGDQVAFISHPVRGDNLGTLMVVDTEGHSRKLGEEWMAIQGAAWAASGDEVWVAAENVTTGELHAIDLHGHERVLWRGPALPVLYDVSRDGKVLMVLDDIREHIMLKSPGADHEQDISWLDAGCSCALSADGKSILIGESGVGGGARGSAYFRKLDGSPPVRLGDGFPLALSPDGNWALTLRHDSPQQVVVLPTGAGDAKRLAHPNIKFAEAGTWLPDNRHVVMTGREGDRGFRVYELDIDGGGIRPLTPEDTRGDLISPDGKLLLARNPSGWFLFPLDGAPPTPVDALQGLSPVDWTSNAQEIFARSGGMPAHIVRVNLKTGERRPWRDLMPADLAGSKALQHVHFSSDGETYAYTYFKFNARLFVVDGLR